MLTISEASSSLGFAGCRRHARGRRRRSAFLCRASFSTRKIGEDLDPIGPRATGWCDTFAKIASPAKSGRLAVGIESGTMSFESFYF